MSQRRCFHVNRDYTFLQHIPIRCTYTAFGGVQLFVFIRDILELYFIKIKIQPLNTFGVSEITYL